MNPQGPFALLGYATDQFHPERIFSGIA